MNHNPTRRFLCGGLFFLIAAILSGCSSATRQILPVVADERPTSDKALIVVERASGGVGSAVSWKVYDNSTFVGELGAGGKLAWLRAPGTTDLQFAGDDRYNGPMALVIQASKINSGRSLTVAAGKAYHFKITKGWDDLTIDGPGIPLNAVTNIHYTRVTPDEPLVFFRLLPKESSGVITIVDIKGVKPISLAVNPPGKQDPWLALYLPAGQYNVVTYTITTDKYPIIETRTYKINADFTLAVGNAAVYLGDLTISQGELYIRKDTPAARAYIEQNSKELTFTESILEFNK